MATIGELNVKINADLAPLLSSLKAAKKQMSDFDKALSKSSGNIKKFSSLSIRPRTNLSDMKKLDAAIIKSRQNIQKLSNTSVRPRANTSEVQRLGTEIDKIKNKINQVNSSTISPKTGTRGSSGIDSMNSTVSRLAVAAGTYLGVREIKEFADAWTEAGNKMRAAAEIAGVQTRSLEDLNKIAKETRSGFTETADLYAKFVRSASKVAKSEQEIADATATVNKAFKAGGATTQEQISGITQLAQALGSGLLQGDELRSIRENAPLVAQAIADEFKTTIAGIKKLGEDGKLTSDRVFKAILSAKAKVDKAFAETNPTIADGITNLNNALTEYIGKTNEAYGITKTINGILGALAGNIESVANAAAAAALVLATAFGRGSAVAAVGALLNPWVALAAAVGAAAYAISEFWDDIVPLQGSFATLGDYAGAVWDIITEGATTAKGYVVGAFDVVLSSIEAVLGGINVSFQDVWDTLKSFVNNTIDSFIRLKDIVAVTFTQLPQAVADGVISAMNFMIDKIEGAINKIINGVNQAIKAINSLGAWAGVDSLIGEIGSVSLGRVENKFAGAGKEAAKAFGEIFTRDAKDYIGMAGEAFNDGINAITARANQRARERRANAKDADSAPDAASKSGSFPALNTKGYGGGIPSTDSGKKKKAKESDWDKEIRQIREKTAALQAETTAQAQLNPLVNDYGFAVARASAASDLLAAAKKQGLAIGKEASSVEKILAGDFSGLSEKAKEQARVIIELAGAFGLATAEGNKLDETQERLKATAEEFRNLGKDVMGGFIKDLIDGKSASEALANALGKVADKLMDIALDNLWGTGNNKGGGIFGGLIGGLASLFGGGGSLLTKFPAGKGLWADGGYTGVGAKMQPAGVVHKGEVVWSQSDVKRAGGVQVVEAMRRGAPGYASGGVVKPYSPGPIGGSSMSGEQSVHVTVGWSRTADGNLRPFVENVSQQTTGQMLVKYDKNLPDRVNKISSAPRRR